MTVIKILPVAGHDENESRGMSVSLSLIRPLTSVPALRKASRNISICILFPLVCESLFEFFDGKFGLYPEHFSGFSPSFLISS